MCSLYATLAHGKLTGKAKGIMMAQAYGLSTAISSLLIGGVMLMGCTSGQAQAARSSGIRVDAGFVHLTNAGRDLPVSLGCPLFTIGDKVIGGNAPVRVTGDIGSSGGVQAEYEPVNLGDGELDVKLHLRWSAKESVLRKWASYRVTGGDPGVVKQAVLDSIATSEKGLRLISKQPAFYLPQSYPVFFEGFFAGIEFPVASTHIEDGHAVIAHQPGLRMQSGVWYDTRTAAYGTTTPGREWDEFKAYIESHRPEPRGTFVLYDNWLSTANAYSEQEMLGLMDLLSDKLYKQNGVSIDAFRLVCTWSDAKSIWEIDRKRLPDGFASFRKAVEAGKGHMGLWISPSSCYPFAQDAEWAGRNGYETLTLKAGDSTFHHTCVAGQEFRDKFLSNLLSLVKTYDIRHIQFDGYRFECPEAGHGHEPGALSAEATAAGMVQVFDSLRAVAPKIYLHGAYGGNPSPWWLFHLNAFLVYYGDDAPAGRVPAPNYLESYTSGRDQANLQAAVNCPAPITAHDVYGLYDHTPDPFVNDAVMSVLRGHMTNSIIVNPKFKSDLGWHKIAQAIKWSRANSRTLSHTQPLLPVSWQNGKCPVFSYDAKMPREPYGYAHWDGGRGLIALRNPWMTPTTYALTLNSEIGVPESASGLTAVSIYPEPRVYANALRHGSTIQVPLAPYETVVLSISAHQKTDGIPAVGEALGKRIEARVSRREVSRVEFIPASEWHGGDWTSVVRDAHSALKVSLGAVVEVDASEAELLVLLEDKDVAVDPSCAVKVNGKEVPVTLSDSEAGFAATGLPRQEHWLWLHAPLSKGRNMVSIDLLTRNETPRVSVWALATKPGPASDPIYPNALPFPEVIYLDSVNLLPETTASDAGLTTKQMDRPLERIDGVYLDAFDRSAFAQGSAFFTRNANFLEKQMSVFGRRYFRGLSTAATSRITIPLDGRYRQFQSWVGVDQGMATYDRSGVIFQVIVDGRKQWESTLITRYDAPQRADVDLTGAKSLELVALDGLNQDPVYHTNWSDWGDARLLR